MNDINALAVELNEKLGSQWLTYRAAEEEIKSALTKVSEEASAQAREEAVEILRKHLGDHICYCGKTPVMHMPWNELLPSNQSSGKEK